MTRFLLVRHAVNEWVRTGKLAGWTPEVHLNDEGKMQAKALGERLASAKLEAIYSSPLVRCVETAEEIARHHENLEVRLDDGIGEVHYGEWQGEKLRRLAQRKEWYTVQHFPTRMSFPAGESMRGAQARAVDTIERLHRAHPKGIVVIAGHSDVIKMILAHYLGMHLDMFQRIAVSPASLSILALGSNRPMIENINDTSHIPSSK
ncbi:MAG: MSMEG_4193 family putative phosphomutase [Chloroflexi bacterium]|nr:MSMEG_4193 family putative phosphomutase [Chloroflexota bacterium]